MVMRQTTYNSEETLKLLVKHKYNYMKVIQEYLNKDTPKSLPIDEIPKNVNVNQQIYKEIRTLMDDASRGYRKKIEMTEKRKLYEQIIRQRDLSNNENKKI